MKTYEQKKQDKEKRIARIYELHQKGYTNKNIAEMVGVAASRVSTHLCQIKRDGGIVNKQVELTPYQKRMKDSELKRVKAFEMHKQGSTRPEIAKEIGVRPAQVAKYIETMREREETERRGF
jgi:predicted transcriptional regulator